MPAKLKIDFVSDVACPWCAIGLASLKTALGRLGDEVDADLSFSPFELNPDMPVDGVPLADYMARKYGLSPEQMAQNRANISARAAAEGFPMRLDLRTHAYNTFDAHRLLHWAQTIGNDKQLALKEALLRAYFVEGKRTSDPEVLVEAVQRAGLDAARAREILASHEYAEQVRALERHYQNLGIRSVPAIIFNNRHLVSGGQPPEVFEQAIRQILAEG
ncbi:DsbA family oxidoreductase [Pandoraea nosoerga]|uniref:Disulfide bond formation protein DsbA n=1 Tax=Pandoraea nosoerga TaxID=2508296 RepID=A0A5E4TKY8_9BURK|nr:DsbA family oxidoreductase [Pandoraea nosoerga]MBN4665463.1 DsbA family oxidoreductase [Pandoraea nosoerga]MBN4674988.1 DsbA family oxidoreductase [Pandoraea nosoerga]MBN4680304.1 DsbA family oxidoreductase [Pandoraea nosoerga]MBN4744463.1 DsbA family oxidoreductase [Pandoraea nosoerga]VVD86789.1 disulfide bond formation protein DsbA [Pandoraea nosoerga]